MPQPGNSHRASGCRPVTGRKRRRVISLRLTERELQHLNRLAAQSGLSREKLLRALIMGETRAKKRGKNDRANTKGLQCCQDKLVKDI